MDNTMKEYLDILEDYSGDVFLNSFLPMHTDKILTDKVKAEQYLAKYWLPEQEYLAKWKPIQNKLFSDQYGDGTTPKDNPEYATIPIYHPDFEIMALPGWSLFGQEDFEQLQSCIKAIGDKHLVIIQIDFSDYCTTTFRMKYPIDITWEELDSGDFISAVLLTASYHGYFVFSESGSWGKYAVNDDVPAVDLVGFKPEHASLFRETFKQSAEEQDSIVFWLPQIYKDRIK